MEKAKAKRRIENLRQTIDRHIYLYHVKDDPEISDEAYDSLKQELEELEEEFPEFASPTSPTNRVGGEPLDEFTQVKHEVPQYSFDNVFSPKELEDWHEKTLRFATKAGFSEKEVTYLGELKIDGLKVILTYQDGQLVQAATRGDGRVGEDITQNIKTIQTVPLNLYHKLDLIVGGEVWLSHSEFSRINKRRKKEEMSPFANPRNAAAGSVRQLDPQVAARRNLDFFAYEIEKISEDKSDKFSIPDTQQEELKLLEELHFQVNPDHVYCKELNCLEEFYEDWVDKKESVDYEVDGVVVKVNDKEIQRALGHTATAPRFAVAYKFPAQTTTTVIEDIQLQVGRTGAITPVAHLQPVELDGSEVARATLHNEDEINRLGVRVGDTVVIKKAGDIIPQVVEVLEEMRDGTEKPFKFPDSIPECGGDGTIIRPPGEAKHRCKYPGDTQLHEQFYHFASRQCFDIEGLGPKIIDQLLEENLIENFADIFRLEKDQLLGLERFAEKSADNLLVAIEDARTISLPRFLHALSISYVGSETARLLAEEFGSLAEIRAAEREELEAVDGIGDKVAESVASWFANKDNQEIIDDLLAEIEVEEYQTTTQEGFFAGQTVVFTGSLGAMTRQEAGEAVRRQGGETTGSVSKNTDYLVVGEDPGSKYDKAQELGIDVLEEEDFLSYIK